MSEPVVLAEFDRYRLVGDEDCGVGLECRDCWDGGRPIAYYAGGVKSPYADDPAVADLATVPSLLAVMVRHEYQVHTPRGHSADTA